MEDTSVTAATVARVRPKAVQDAAKRGPEVSGSLGQWGGSMVRGQPHCLAEADGADKRFRVRRKTYRRGLVPLTRMSVMKAVPGNLERQEKE